MPNYQDGKIYKIVCNITDECYIGSTTEPTIARRLATHVSTFKRWKAGKRNKTTSFDIIDRGDYQILLIETYPCNSKDELHSREGEIIRKYKSECECVNSYIAGRTIKEWYQDNKYTIQEHTKEYMKEYREENKEAIKKYNKQYHEDNKNKISEHGKVKITCACGSCYRKAVKNRHERTHKHQSYLKSIE
jgi:DNA-directed RNA polymerase beta' subunit